MLTFYYHPLSPIARRVWLTLLEREIPFEPVLVDLAAKGQHQPDYLALNPFHHVPVVVDDGVRILESLAIVDYLEAVYPQRSLLPKAPLAIAKTRMVQLVTMNELMPQLPKILLSSESPEPDAATMQPVATVLDFFTEQLGDAPYFGGDDISLADVFAGATVPLAKRTGADLGRHPAIAAWHDRIMARPAWQQTEPEEDTLQAWKRWMLARVKRHQRSVARAIP